MTNDTLGSPHLLAELLGRGEEHGTALISAGTSLTYGELRGRVERLSGTLRELGLVPGERVVLALPNGASFVTALVAIWRAGAVPVPLDSRVPAEQLLGIVADCGARGLVCAGPIFAALQRQLDEADSLRFAIVERPPSPRIVSAIRVLAFEQAVEVAEPVQLTESGTQTLQGSTAAPGDLALIAYTSGSTGRPKGVMHTHESLLSSLSFTARHAGLSSASRVLVAIPMHHLFAFRVVLSHLLVGGTVIAERDLFAGLRRIEDSRPDAMILVPAAVQLLVERFSSLTMRLASRIKRVSIGSAAIGADLLEAVQRLLPQTRFLIPYGMTEARIGFLEPVEGRVERRIRDVDPNLELRVLDEEGHAVERGIGEIVLRGRALTCGYWHFTADENRRLREEGLRTRDLAEVTADGGLFLIGRLDDVISVGGEKVFPLEVESALRSHSAVRDVLVTGIEDPRGVLGEVVKATLVLEPGRTLDRDEFVAHCRACLEPYKVPAVFEQSSEIRRNEMGKIVRMNPRREPRD